MAVGSVASSAASGGVLGICVEWVLALCGGGGVLASGVSLVVGLSQA